jgi:hypothetical protein
LPREPHIGWHTRRAGWIRRNRPNAAVGIICLLSRAPTARVRDRVRPAQVVVVQIREDATFLQCDALRAEQIVFRRDAIRHFIDVFYAYGVFGLVNWAIREESTAL